jgi:hypothetical protein
MYMETMEVIMQQAKRIIIDKDAGANTIVPLNIQGGPSAVPPSPVIRDTPRTPVGAN